MRRMLKTLGMVGMIVCASSAVAAANTSAASFRASNTGKLIGVETGAQSFKTAAGTVTCTEAGTSGFVTETETTAQKGTVEYSGCTAFGFASATVSPAEYDLHAAGTVDVLNTIKIHVPLGFCSVTVPSQSGLTSVSYVNQSGKLEELSEIAGITTKGSGGACAGENVNSTYTGNNLLELVGGNIEVVALGGSLRNRSSSKAWKWKRATSYWKKKSARSNSRSKGRAKDGRSKNTSGKAKNQKYVTTDGRL